MKMPPSQMTGDSCLCILSAASYAHRDCDVWYRCTGWTARALRQLDQMAVEADAGDAMAAVRPRDFHAMRYSLEPTDVRKRSLLSGHSFPSSTRT